MTASDVFATAAAAALAASVALVLVFAEMTTPSALWVIGAAWGAVRLAIFAESVLEEGLNQD